MTDALQEWAACSSLLRERLPGPTWHAWIEPLRLDSDEGKYALIAPNSMVRELVQTRFLLMIVQALAEVKGTGPPSLELVVQPEKDVRDLAAIAPPLSHGGRSEGEHSRDLALDSANSSPSDQRVEQVEQVRQSSQSEATNGARGSYHSEKRAKLGLDPRHVFESFVTGESNRFAHAAAQRVAEEPARAYNPLFIYGASGLGKTHLLHAIGHYVHNHFPSLNVCYVSTETFLNEFIESIRTHGQHAFKRQYRGFDVLLVDDIQLLTGKKETQEEFFHTFNSFYDTQKQIVLCSDRHPRSIATLEDRLRSRFESGLTTDIQPPELETRVAILRKKLEGERVAVPEDVLELIATCVKDNIRELEGALIRVVAYASINKVPVTIEDASKVLSDLIAQSAPRQVTPREILEATAKTFGFTVEELCGPSRRRPLVQARQTAMYLLRVLANYSYPAVAAEMGNRDHTTVIHACRKIESQMSLKRQVYDQVTDMIHKIRTAEAAS